MVRACGVVSIGLEGAAKRYAVFAGTPLGCCPLALTPPVRLRPAPPPTAHCPLPSLPLCGERCCSSGMVIAGRAYDIILARDDTDFVLKSWFDTRPEAAAEEGLLPPGRLCICLNPVGEGVGGGVGVGVGGGAGGGGGRPGWDVL